MLNTGISVAIGYASLAPDVNEDFCKVFRSMTEVLLGSGHVSRWFHRCRAGIF